MLRAPHAPRRDNGHRAQARNTTQQSDRGDRAHVLQSTEPCLHYSEPKGTEKFKDSTMHDLLLSLVVGDAGHGYTIRGAIAESVGQDSGT